MRAAEKPPPRQRLHPDRRPHSRGPGRRRAEWGGARLSARPAAAGLSWR